MMDISETNNERDVSKDIDNDYASNEMYAPNDMLIQTNTKAGIESGSMSMVSSAQNLEDRGFKAKGKSNLFNPTASQASVAMLIDNNSEEDSEPMRNGSGKQLQNTHEELLRDRENGSEEIKSHFLPAINGKGSNQQLWAFKEEIPEALGDEDSVEREPPRPMTFEDDSLRAVSPLGEDPNNYISPPSLDNDSNSMEN